MSKLIGLAGTAAALLALCALLPSHAAPKPVLASNRTPAALNTTSSMMVTWVPVTYKSSKIVKVGGVDLPLPLSLPRGLKPLGNKALLWTRPNEKGPLFWIYFNASSETAVKKWAAGLPNDFPLPSGSYTLPKPIKHRDLSPGNRWYYSTTAQALTGSVNFVCLGGPKDVKDQKYAQLPYAFKHLVDVRTQSNPPIARQSRWVSEFIGFSKETPRK